MTKEDICECCNTNTKKAAQSKYCVNCSDYICNMILQRTHRIDARYKKVFRSLHTKLQRLSEEDAFLPKQLQEMMDREQAE
ncbi:hypothetical protein KY362_01550 [Candidatus Woesearchaeota archaeon]|nr:hypothetical protein [Candidatus Woesearchaeota archaeon]